MSKSIFKSKTFWLNVLGAVVMVGTNTVPQMGLDPATAGLVLAGLNIANRTITDSAVHIVPPAQ